MNHSSRIRLLAGMLLFLCGFALPLAAQSSGDFTYTSDGSAITITGYTGPDGMMVIPASILGLPVTSIANGAIQSKGGVSGVTFPASLTRIGEYAFSGCANLMRVTIPASVTDIGGGAFGGCGSLMAIDVDPAHSVYSSSAGVLFDKAGTTLIQFPAGKGGVYAIPEAVTSIAGRAFSNCYHLTGVTVPASVTNIGPESLIACSSLLTITVEAANAHYKSLDGVLFNKAGTSLIQYPGGRSGPYLIPDGVTEFDTAFAYCGVLTAVTIPASVTRIGSWAFFSCDQLGDAIFLGNAPSMGGQVFDGAAPGFTVRYYEGATGFTPTTWQGYPAASFVPAPTFITQPASQTIGSGSTAILTVAATGSPAPTFQWHLGESGDTSSPISGATSATFTTPALTATTRYWVRATNSQGSVNSQTAVILVGSPVSDFNYTSNGAAITITGYTGTGGAVVIPATINAQPVTSLGSYAFAGNVNLTSISIPDSVTAIGIYVFRGCTGLTRITIPGSATTIGYAVFEDCTGLISAVIGNGVTSIGGYMFHNCTSLASVSISDSVTAIGDYAFLGCKGLTHVSIPDSITAIGNFAFRGCTGLTSITIPGSTTTIGDAVFEDCTGITSAAIGNGVTSIGGYMFHNCTSLASVSIPDSVTTIGIYVFRGCTGLTSVTIPGSATTIGYAVFEDCTGLTSAIIGNGVTSIGGFMFDNCISLASVSIPDSVTAIGDYAFAGNVKLSSINLPASIVSIGDYAFANSGLANAIFKGNAPVLGSSVFQNTGPGFAVYFKPGAVGFTTPTWQGYPSASFVPAPTFTTQPASQTIGSGSTAILTVAATGNPLPTFQWHLGESGDTSSPISGATSATFTTPALTATTRYWVRATNSQGSVNSQTAVISVGSPVSDFTWISDGTAVTITGYTGAGGAMVIPSQIEGLPVKVIGNSAFSGKATITSVAIPSGISSIGNSAFSSCIGLTSVTIPASVTTIGNGAFSSCSALRFAIFQGNAPTMGTDVFQNRSSGFTVYFQSGAAGFTTPTWQGYPTSFMGGTGTDFNTVGFNFYHGQYPANQVILATQHTATLDAAADLNTRVWHNISFAGGLSSSNGKGRYTTGGITVRAFSSNESSAGSEAAGSNGDASQRVFRSYLDDGDGGNGYYNGDGIGASVHITGIKSLLEATGATEYRLTVFYNSDNASNVFPGVSVRRGVPDFSAVKPPSALTAIPGLTVIGTTNVTVLGGGLQPNPAAGTLTASNGRRAWGQLAGLTESDITLSLPVISGSTRATLAGFAITTNAPYAAPSITTQPADLTVTPGSTATLRMAATGSPPPSYQWYRGQSGDTSNPVAGAISATYVTPPLASTTAYWVRASNPVGTADSGTATLSVVATPGATWRYLRLLTLQTRNPDEDCTQLAEISFFRLGQPVAVSSVTNPGGINPSGQGPASIRDGNTATKWLDYNKKPLVFDLGSAKAVDAYTLTTASDILQRDPVQWRLEGSANGTDWTILDQKTSEEVPAARLTMAGPYGIDGNAAAPKIVLQPTDSSVVSGTSASLTAALSGNPTPTVEWFRGQSGDTSNPLAGTAAGSYSTLVTGPLAADTAFWFRASYTSGLTSSNTIKVKTVAPASDSGLVHRWSFNDVKDSVGGINLSLVGSATLKAGQLDLPGSTTPRTHYASVPIGPTIAGLDSMSVEAWFSLDSLSSWIRVWSFGVANGGVEPGASLASFSPNSSTAYPRIDINTVTASTISTAGSGEPNTLGIGKRYHSVTVYDFANNVMHLYLDGILADSATLGGRKVKEIGSTALGYLGAMVYSNTDYDLDGQIDEMRIWNRPLTAAEVAANFVGGPDQELTPPPVIITPPAAQSVVSASGATLTVAATGFPSPTFQWYLGKSGDLSNPVAGATLSSFTTPGLFAPASYWVRATNSEGHADSAAAAITVTKSNDANLSALTLSRGSLVPAFSPSSLGYSASVSHGTATMTVTPVIAHPLATAKVRVGGGALVPIASGETSADLPLDVGGNIIEIIVTAEDGTERTTFVIVSRAPEFTGTAGWPLAATGAPADVTITSATLVGAVDPQLFATSVRFEYGSTPLLGTTTPTVTLPAGAGVKDVAIPITGLIPAGTYHYRIIATNDAGQALGDIVSFPAIPIHGRTTPSAAPLIVTGSATAINQNSATIGGTVNAFGGTTLVHIEYGRDSVQEAKTLATGVGNPEAPAQVALALEGLLPGTTYRYRLVAVNSLGISRGAESSFTTSVPLPGAVTGNASSLGTTSAMVEGTADANDTETRVFFDYGPAGGEFPLSVAADPFVISGGAETPVAATLHNLGEGATYQYRVRAVNSGGTAYGEVREFSVDALSGLLQVVPAPVPLAERIGFALVLLDPAGIGTGWRFAGETTWRQPGIPAAGLVTGDRRIEFRPVPGYVAPEAEPVLITSGGAATVISRGYVATAAPGSSNLRVILKPDALAEPSVPAESRAQWRLAGTTQWRDSGTVATGLPAGSHLIECKPVNGRTAPQATMVTVADGESGSVTLTYFPAELSAAALPALDPYDLSSADPAAAFTGQIRGGGASGSGFAVGRRVVATAAHVVWDEGTLAAVPDLQWLFQRDAGTHEPVPQLPRGFHILTGYAVQRALENSPGTASPASQVRDVAALYFPNDVARGGYSGFLASDLPINEYLVSSASKRLVGYPVEDIAASSLGRLHATPSVNQPLVSATGRTYTSTFLRGRGGMSGGPLSVLHEKRGTWFPAAIYLGGSNQMVVRAIDGEVVELFRMAERSASGGGNDTGGGITHSSVTAFGPTSQPGAIEVTIEPAAALDAGGRWGLDAGNATRASGNQLGAVNDGNHVLHFKTVPGFLPPTPQTVKIRGGQLLAVTFAYEPVRTPLENWRLLHFSTAKVQADSQDGADPDGDGQTNLQEFSAGTDPNNGADLFKVLSVTRNGSTFTLLVHGQAGRTYALERRDGLATGSWQRVPGTAAGPLAVEGPVTLTDPQAPPDRAFYRVVVSQP